MNTVPHRIIKANIDELTALNERGEYGGQAAEIRRDLKHNLMVWGFSSAGNTLWRKANGRDTVDFDAALESYQ